jgi:hypothetical protein
MTYTVVPDKAVGATFTEAMWDTYIKDNFNAGLARPLAHTQLGSAAASVTFSSIPGTMGALAVVWSARGDNPTLTVDHWVRFNADSSAIYEHEVLHAIGTAITASETLNTNQARVGQMSAATAVANAWGAGVVWIPSYASASVYKASVGFCGLKWNTAAGSFRVHTAGSTWRSVAAVTSLVFLPAGGNFIAGSRFTLYGLGLPA